MLVQPLEKKNWYTSAEKNIDESVSQLTENQLY